MATCFRVFEEESRGLWRRDHHGDQGHVAEQHVLTCPYYHWRPTQQNRSGKGRLLHPEKTNLELRSCRPCIVRMHDGSYPGCLESHCPSGERGGCLCAFRSTCAIDPKEKQALGGGFALFKYARLGSFLFLPTDLLQHLLALSFVPEG